MCSRARGLPRFQLRSRRRHARLSVAREFREREIERITRLVEWRESRRVKDVGRERRYKRTKEVARGVSKIHASRISFASKISISRGQTERKRSVNPLFHGEEMIVNRRINSCRKVGVGSKDVGKGNCQPPRETGGV